MVKKFGLLLLLFTSIVQVQAQKKESKKNRVEENNKATAPAGLGIPKFDHTKFDFGNIGDKGGQVWHDFHFINAGKGPLTIINVITSCGCTRSEWTRTPVMPGDSGMVRAVFDPVGRQGKMDKDLLVECDGSPSSQNLNIAGMVYATRYNFSEKYKYQYGHLAVETNVINFNSVKNTGYDSVEVGMYNMSNKGIYLYRIDAPGNIMVSKPYDLLPPNTEIKLKVRYYPHQPLEYGSTRQEFRIHTSDDSLATKRFFINANIVEDFSHLTKQEIKKAPKINLNTMAVDLGNVQYSKSPVATFVITNKGKSDLIIRKVARGNASLIPELSQTVIPKGKTATLNVTYNLTNIAGPDIQTLKLITNDPNQPELTISVKINVTE